MYDELDGEAERKYELRKRTVHPLNWMYGRSGGLHHPAPVHSLSLLVYLHLDTLAMGHGLMRLFRLLEGTTKLNTQQTMATRIVALQNL